MLVQYFKYWPDDGLLKTKQEANNRIVVIK